MNKVFVGAWSSILGVSAIMASGASANGSGLPTPSKQPVSVREGSVRGTGTNGHGHYRTRYFIGGGLHGGK